MRMKKTLVLLLLSIISAPLFLSTTSCKKTVTNTIVDTFRHAWQEVTYFNNYGQQALNSANIGDSELLVAGNSQVIRLAVNHASFDWFFSNFLYGSTWEHPVTGAPFVNDHLCAYAVDSSYGLTSVPVYSQFSYLGYTPVRSDSVYPWLQFPFAPPSLCYPASSLPVIRSHYLLVPVGDYRTDRNTARLDLVTFDSARIFSPMGLGDSPVVKPLYLHPASGTIGFFSSNYFCASFFDKFFVYYEGQFYRVDTTGNVKNFGYTPAPYAQNYGIGNMFTHGDTLFAKSASIFFYSTDHGETWALFNDFSSIAISYLTVRNVGHDLYATAATLDMQIWKVAFNGRDLVLSEINNDGLQGTLLTSLTKCGKYVFATTFNGVYYRDTASIDQLKTPVR
jgi:hypothetical protein